MEDKEKLPFNVPFVSLAQAVVLLDCSRSFIYGLINEGKLKPKYIGAKPYIMMDNILEIMTEKPREI